MKSIVLAGGKSSRFGTNKAFALLEGVPMIQRAVQLLAQLQLDPCVVTSAAHDYSFLNLKIATDIIPDQGPVGGIYTAFCQSEAVPLVILTCDMPMVSAEALRALIKAYQASYDVVLFQNEQGNAEPFPGIYGPRLKPLAYDCIQSGQQSMWQFIKKIPKEKVLCLRGQQDIFLNVNSQVDLQKIPKSS